VGVEVAVEVHGEDVEVAATGILGVVTTVVDGEVCILMGELHQIYDSQK